MQRALADETPAAVWTPPDGDPLLGGCFLCFARGQIGQGDVGIRRGRRCAHAGQAPRRTPRDGRQGRSTLRAGTPRAADGRRAGECGARTAGAARCPVGRRHRPRPSASGRPGAASRRGSRPTHRRGDAPSAGRCGRTAPGPYRCDESASHRRRPRGLLAANSSRRPPARRSRSLAGRRRHRGRRRTPLLRRATHPEPLREARRVARGPPAIWRSRPMSSPDRTRTGHALRGGGRPDGYARPGEAAAPGPPVTAVDDPAVPSAGTHDPHRVERIGEAVVGWTDELAALGGRDPLLSYRDLKVGTLDLAAADPEARKRLLDGEPVPVSRLFPPEPLRTSALRWCTPSATSRASWPRSSGSPRACSPSGSRAGPTGSRRTGRRRGHAPVRAGRRARPGRDRLHHRDRRRPVVNPVLLARSTPNSGCGSPPTISAIRPVGCGTRSSSSGCASSRRRTSSTGSPSRTGPCSPRSPACRRR